MNPLHDRTRALIGQPGSRWRLPTPALVVDLDRLERNIARMTERARTAGLTLRPHAKTHKSAAICKMQLAAGAAGICCAKIGEAEALIGAGVRNVLLTSPIVDRTDAERCVALRGLDPRLSVVVDHPVGVEALAAAAEAVQLDVLIDVDVGLGRTGVANSADARELALRIAAAPSLRLVGVQGYGGHWQHWAGAEARHAAVADGMARLTAVIGGLREAGHQIRTITGGGTGTFAADRALGVLNEVQPGSYVFMDQQYRDALGADTDAEFEDSLFVQARVVSTNAAMWVTVDAGSKAFATDGPAPQPVSPDFAGQTYFYFGDEHGGVTRPPGDPIPHGRRIEFSVPHCDPTVDRYEVLHLVRGDTLVDVVTIEAARRSQ